jgi:hypothetical protein
MVAAVVCRVQSFTDVSGRVRQPRGDCWKTDTLATIRWSGSWMLAKANVGR